MSLKSKRELIRILIAGVLFAVLMGMKAADVSLFITDRELFYRLAFLIPFIVSGYPVLYRALLGVKNLQMLDESFLMTLASIGAVVTGEVSEAAAVMLFYQVGEWFEGFALGRSRESIKDLMDIVPEHAYLETDEGKVEEIDPDEIIPGNILLVKPGERIPTDGVVLVGSGMVNTAALTGESVPRFTRPGDEVISGCINGDSLLKIRAEKAFEDSTVSRILELVENAAAKKSRTENFITRFARIYTPAVVLSAVLIVLAGTVFTGDFLRYVYRACTFLVISCPCALVISVPLSFFGGIGAAGRNGVLVKGSNFLELLSNVHTAVFDKTGTLTEGNFAVQSVIPAAGTAEADVLYKAALAEGHSTHPIALSIREAYEQRGGRPEDLPLPEAAEAEPGMGLKAISDGHVIHIGNDLFMKKAGIPFTKTEDPRSTVSYAACDGRYLGAILIRDQVKPGSDSAIRQLKKAGAKEAVMLTGDRKEVGEAVGRELGLDRVFSELLPEGKVRKMEEILEERKRSPQSGCVVFIGDGMNDAPVLMRSDVGIAMGSMGSDAAIEAADVVIMDDDLMRLPVVMRIARKTVSIARQNILFALSVKLLILLSGAMGYTGMWAAVFADVGVAVLCILNSMRLLRIRKTISL